MIKRKLGSIQCKYIAVIGYVVIIQVLKGFMNLSHGDCVRLVGENGERFSNV